LIRPPGMISSSMVCSSWTSLSSRCLSYWWLSWDMSTPTLDEMYATS
jgi:hypothetical protein